jgi:hypothetical protein
VSIGIGSALKRNGLAELQAALRAAADNVTHQLGSEVPV